MTSSLWGGFWGARRQGLGFGLAGLPLGIWEFLKIRGTLFWGPYDKDPTTPFRVLYLDPLFSETPI